MTINKQVSHECRLCKYTLPATPIFHLDHVPHGVQYFPSMDSQEIQQAHSLDVYQCISCSLVQLTSDPVIYEEATTSATAFSSKMIDYRTTQMQEFVERFNLTGKTILDVGCGDGNLMSCILQAGAQAIGIDASEKALAIARDKGLQVQQGYIGSTSQIEGAPFEAFVSTDVIEHVSDVRDFLVGIRNNLQDGAIGIIETPNFEQTLTHQRFYDLVLDHLIYFTKDSLRLSLEMSGFEIIEITHTRNNENLIATVRKRNILDLSSLKQHSDLLLNNLSEFIQTHKIQGKQIAIWGASYQTLTLSTLTSISNVAYIIDAAPYKQGRLTPVSRIPIVSPQQLNESPVDTILVITSRFADEIIRQIKDNHNFDGMIAKLDGTAITIIRG